MVATVQIDVSTGVKRLRRLAGDINENRLLRAIGLRHLQWVNDNFRMAGALHPRGKWPQLAPNTIAKRRRGSSLPLMDTGRLRQSYTSRVLASQVTVGSSERTAKWHQDGTRPYTITPRAARFLKFAVPGGTVFSRGVRHPGVPARPMIPTKNIAHRMAVGVVSAEIDRVVTKSNRRKR